MLRVGRDGDIGGPEDMNLNGSRVSECSLMLGCSLVGIEDCLKTGEEEKKVYSLGGHCILE